MNQKTINQISKTVYKQFPEIRGSRPKIKQQPYAKTLKADANYVLTYRAIAALGNGKRIPRQVRVVANRNGKIIRISTSR
jgi:predicted small secreted protein